MKICANCQAQNADNSQFCKQCGATLPNGFTPNNAYAYQQAPQSPYPQAPQNPFPLLQALKRQGGSPLFLIAIICLSASLLFSFLSIFNQSVYAYLDAVLEYAEMMEIDTSMIDFSAMSAGFTAGNIIVLIPDILLVIGLWMVFANCKKSGNAPLSTTGFSIMRGVMIFKLVLFIIAIVICAFVIIVLGSVIAAYAAPMATATYSVSDSSAADIAGFYMIFIVLFLLIYVVLQLLYYIKIIGSLKRAKQIVVTGTTDKNVSAYVGVLAIIGGVFGILGALITSISSGEIGVAGLFSSVAALLFGVLIMSVRSEFAAGLMANSPYNQ